MIFFLILLFLYPIHPVPFVLYLRVIKKTDFYSPKWLFGAFKKKR